MTYQHALFIKNKVQTCVCVCALLSWNWLQGPSLEQQSILFDDRVTDGVTRGALVAIAAVRQEHDLDHDWDAVPPQQNHLRTRSPCLTTLDKHARKQRWRVSAH